jgi:Flavin-binding monooxygenase-like
MFFPGQMGLEQAEIMFTTTARAASRRPPPVGGLDRSTADKYCILGAGSSGLAVAKNFQQQGIPYDCLERENDIGGNWYYGKPHSSVYRSTRLISSKRLTEYTDFPMPEDYPEYPDHELVWRYLRSYAAHYGLYQNIRFKTSIHWVEPAADAGWVVTLAGGERQLYRGVVIANGHNWDPRWPDYPGEFDGAVVHSSQYKTPDVLAGRRVLVVGGGNSGYDIAAESARYAARTFHSLRRSYPVLPKFFRGCPVDECGDWMRRWRLPLWLQRLAAARVRRLVWGAEKYPDLPLPDHQLFETHPVINSRWPYDVARGSIAVKPDVRELCGRHVHFVDGSSEPIDLIVYATGFNISFPFLDVTQLNWRDGRPDLHLNVFHPERDDVFVAGLIQPTGGQFGLVDYQAQLIALYLRGLKGKTRAAKRFQRLKRIRRPSLSGGSRFVSTPRHLLEVEHFTYRRALAPWIARLAR